MKRLNSVIACMLLMLAFAVVSCATDTPEPDFSLKQPDTDVKPEIAYMPGSYTDPVSGNAILYRLFKPDVPPQDGDKRGYPLVVFLHGIGERGSDNMAQLKTGAKYFLSWKNHYPCYILFPQCPKDLYWHMSRPRTFDPDSMPFRQNVTWMYGGLTGLIDNVIRTNNINRDRVILVGYSMGAISALDFASRIPDRFAGVASIAGTMPKDRMPLMAATSMYVYHNDSDGMVPSKGSHMLVDTLQSMGADVTGRFFAPGGHVTLSLFDTSEFMQWVYSRRRK